ncbi:hypothetical protein AXG93_909s1060 [Marchantia polymorpha subsp. ruderalis]|uniref:Pyroglutamyl-peptidase I n=1 Tax=Marchantia polymorpha subsp. ruderalis TaxID=1480154 RepID=A0A176VHK9_MARPO|nr:hypothetical protein AXG93_909s1060 [Marchantia polymorpha subsp. ruderalis]
MGSEARAPPAMRFNLTGFGKFHNVPENPSETIVRKAREVLGDRPLPFGATIAGCTVLDTAGAGGLEALRAILDAALVAGAASPKEGAEGAKGADGAEGAEAVVVWVHLGVNGGATRFAIEQRAVNEATFRCADEMGWEPEEEPVVAADGAISRVRETAFAAGKITEAMQKQGFDVALSTDAGRFVCNYVYYQSLRHAATHGTRSLFVHGGRMRYGWSVIGYKLVVQRRHAPSM